jgi:hypothetical protein
MEFSDYELKENLKNNRSRNYTIILSLIILFISKKLLNYFKILYYYEIYIHIHIQRYLIFR